MENNSSQLFGIRHNFVTSSAKAMATDQIRQNNNNLPSALPTKENYHCVQAVSTTKKDSQVCRVWSKNYEANFSKIGQLYTQACNFTISAWISRSKFALNSFDVKLFGVISNSFRRGSTLYQPRMTAPFKIYFSRNFSALFLSE